MDKNDGAASLVRSDALFGALGECVEAVKRYPTTLTAATQPVGEIVVGEDVWCVDIAIYKKANANNEARL